MPRETVAVLGRRLQCSLCEHSYNRGCDLGRHMKLAHGPQEDLPCARCGRTCRTTAALARHVWAHESASRRFWERVEKAEGDGCWVWTKAMLNPGRRRGSYGRLRFMDKLIVAHRFAWEEANGPVPDGLSSITCAATRGVSGQIT